MPKARYFSSLKTLFILAAIALSATAAQAKNTSSFQQIKARLVFATSDSLSVIQWSAASDLLVVYSIGSGGTYTYNIEQEMLSKTTKRVPGFADQLPVLSKNELTAFSTRVDEFGRESLQFISPNKQFVVYTSNLKRQSPDRSVDSNLFALMIGDRQSKQITDTHLSVDRPTSIESFNVLWNRKSNTFSVTAFLGEGLDTLLLGTVTITDREGLKVVTIPSLKNVDAKIVNSFQFAQGGVIYLPAPKNIYAISDNGRQILLRVTKDYAMNASSNVRLGLIDINEPSQSKLIPSLEGLKVYGATFFENSETRIWIMTEQGLQRYDFQTENLSLVDPTINRSWLGQGLANQVLFSPDRKWLALIRLNSASDKYYEVYLLRLTE